MACDHLGPQELFALAEQTLRDRGLSADRWSGAKFRHGENLDGGMWASVVMEVERRGDQWIVTRLDRNRERLPESDCGLTVIAEPAGA